MHHYVEPLTNDAGRDLMMGQAELVGWLTNDIGLNGRATLQAYRHQLKARTLTGNPRPPREMTELDMLNSDLSASVALLTGLLVSKIQKEQDDCSDAIASYGVTVGSNETAPERHALENRYHGLQVRLNAFYALIEPLGEAHKHMNDLIAGQLSQLQDAHRTQANILDGTAVHEVAGEIAEQGQIVARRLKGLMDYVQNERPSHPNTPAESRMYDFCIDHLAPRIERMEKLLSNRSKALSQHWQHFHHEYWPMVETAPKPAPDTTISNVVFLSDAIGHQR